MNKKNRKISVIVALSLVLLSCQGGEKRPVTALNTGQPQETVVRELTANLADYARTRTRLRLAVMDLSPTQSEWSNRNVFGTYFAETLSSALSGSDGLFKLYERKLLNKILQEQKLSLSGAIKEEDAIKIGELAPIDALVSGTYTRLADSVDINIRLIDVVTGQILVSFTGRILSDNNLNSLFENAPVGKPNVNPCDEKKKKAETLLVDLSTPEKIETMATFLTSVSPSSECGFIHDTAAQKLSDNRVASPLYRAFCIKALTDDTILETNRITYLRMAFYLNSDGKTDDKEWEAIMIAAPKMERPINYSSLLRYFIYSQDYSRKFTDEELKLITGHIDSFMRRVKDKKFGLPVPLEYDPGFLDMYQALIIAKDPRPFIYLIKNYANGLQTKTHEKYADTIRYQLKRSEDQNTHKELTEIACRNFKVRDDDQIVYDLWQFAEEAEKMGGEVWNLFLKECKPLMAKLFPDYAEKNDKVIPFAKKYGIPLKK